MGADVTIAFGRGSDLVALVEGKLNGMRAFPGIISTAVHPQTEQAIKTKGADFPTPAGAMFRFVSWCWQAPCGLLQRCCRLAEAFFVASAERKPDDMQAVMFGELKIKRNVMSA